MSEPAVNWRSWLRLAVQRLSASESPRRDAEILLGRVTGKTRSTILAFDETPLSAEQQQQLEGLLSRRQQGEPIAYLMGEREFWSLPLQVSPATLIPRPDTECLVEQALARLPACACDILDLGTGTGAIALALASERPDCQITALDIVMPAVELARENARQLALNNVHILQSNWFTALQAGQQRFAMIVSNPPYIDAQDPHLLEGDVRFEPRCALVAAEHGLADLATIIRDARRFLVPGGWLLLEHGWQQAAMVRKLLQQAGYQQISSHRDYGHHERLSAGQWAVAMAQ